MAIDAAGLAANLLAIRAAVGQGTEVLAVIKANAYGHGAALCAPVLVNAGVAWLGVSDVEEGVAVRQSLARNSPEGGDARILVMCGFEPEDAAALVQHELTPVVWTADHLLALQRAAEVQNRRVHVHVEVDTGMTRQGVAPGAALLELFSVLQHSSRLRYEGLFTHLSSAETVFGMQTGRQLHAFGVALGTQPLSSLLLPDLLHLANTSAVNEGSTTEWLTARAADAEAQPMVRTGLALFGHALPLLEEDDAISSRGARLGPSLSPVATWKTRILDLRTVDAGTSIGYGATFVAERTMRLALLPIGYADGFRREASSGIGNGWVQIAGKRAPVVGRVSMNLTVVDVTDIASAAAGAEVFLLGAGVTAEDHAAWCGTIPYEILCGIRAHRALKPISPPAEE